MLINTKTKYLEPLKSSSIFALSLLLFGPLAFADNNDVSNDKEKKVKASEVEHIEVVGKQNSYSQLRESAKAVDLIDTEFAQKMTVDLGEVMARTPGISVRRSGGLGSAMRFSLNGLTGNKVRFFVDGLPLEISGFRAGISNIPVNLVEHVEVYQGVVPVEFGADALGGAVNLVTKKNSDNLGSVSHQIGSFGTRRSTVSLNYANNDFFSRLNAYSDRSDNNYDIDVMVPKGNGSLQQELATVERFHDGYKAEGLTFDLGFNEQSWADLIQISVFHTGMDKDIQHNAIMAVPYGEMTFSRESQGINVKYEYSLTEQLNLSAVVGKSATDSHFIDVADYKYNWFGEPHFELASGHAEVNQDTNIIVMDGGYLARINIDWQVSPNHQIKFLLAPSWYERTGQNLLKDSKSFDSATAESKLKYLVSGIEYSAALLEQRLKNILFVKHYSMDVDAEFYIGTGSEFDLQQEQRDKFGWGNALRYDLGKNSFIKMSYENAVRLPSSRELLGSGVSEPNVELEPEVSDNYNLSYTLENLSTEIGDFQANTTLFIREIQDLIQWTPVAGRDSRNPEGSYKNISDVTSEGIQGGLGWTSVEGLISAKINTTWMDYYNANTGNRIANEPYYYANASLRLNWDDVLRDIDAFTLSWHTRFVEGFSIVPENVTASTDRLEVPMQVSHSFGINYSTDISDYTTNFSTEIQNLTDEKLFDFKGVQRPGRSFNAKIIVNF